MKPETIVTCDSDKHSAVKGWVRDRLRPEYQDQLLDEDLFPAEQGKVLEQARLGSLKEAPIEVDNFFTELWKAAPDAAYFRFTKQWEHD